MPSVNHVSNVDVSRVIAASTTRGDSESRFSSIWIIRFPHGLIVRFARISLFAFSATALSAWCPTRNKTSRSGRVHVCARARSKRKFNDTAKWLLVNVARDFATRRREGANRTNVQGLFHRWRDTLTPRVSRGKNSRGTRECDLCGHVSQIRGRILEARFPVGVNE